MSQMIKRAPSQNVKSNPSKPIDASGIRRRLKVYLIAGILFSIIVNLLMLVSPLYMLQVYDRVLTSGSVDTLISISILAISLLGVYGIAEMARRRIMVLAGKGLPGLIGKTLYTDTLKTPHAASRLPQAFGQLNTLQNFLANGLIFPLFDLPFSPLFIVIMFMIHQLIGWLGLRGVVLLLCLAILTEWRTRKPIEMAQMAERQAQSFTDDLSRQQSAIVSLGMANALFNRWAMMKSQAGMTAEFGAQRAGAYSSLIRSLRIILQVTVLGLGGWLVLQFETSAGAIIAGSILLGRALAPIDQLVGNWRQYVQIQKAWKHIRQQLDGVDDPDAFTPLPRPEAELILSNTLIGPPGTENPILPKFNATFPPGSITLLFGASGTGKTSFLQTVSGAWPPLEGHVMLGGRELHRWPADDRGQYVGYLPQKVELLPGTVFENIARFQAVEPEAVMAAAQAAACHRMILSLPDGYDTQIAHIRSDVGIHLSAGQSQMVGLARALFGYPALILLDEPTANLDAASVDHFKTYLRRLKAPDTVIVIASHDPRLAEIADSIVNFRLGSIAVEAPGAAPSAARDARQQPRPLKPRVVQ